MTKESDESIKWQGLARASILSTTTRKLYGYIQLADQKAMGLIIMNSIIIPIAMKSVNTTNLHIAATIAIITGIISIFMSILCIFPKRSRSSKPDGTKNLLHYSDIGHMKEEEFMTLMLPIYNDPPSLGIEVLKDMHDVSHRVLIPKFRLLKLSYIIFFFGNLIAIAAFLYKFWGNL